MDEICDSAVGFGNTLTDLDERLGFWVRMISAVTLAVNGTIPITSIISLKTGWNMVGLPSSAVMLLPDVFSSQCIDLSMVYAYHGNDSADQTSPGNSLAGSSKLIVVLGTTAAVIILATIIWFVLMRRPKA
jgi:hypothetical protein